MMIICHGLDDTSDNFFNVAKCLLATVPYAKFILPTAPMRKVTMNGGMEMPSWYGIIGLDRRLIRICESIKESCAPITSLVEHKTLAFSLPCRCVILAGFIQGSSLSLYTGMQLSSGGGEARRHCRHEWVPPPLLWLPVFYGHGELDLFVWLDAARESPDIVTSGRSGTDYRLVKYPNLGH
jgi:predicted esterase